jgi:hypothetical protein
MLVVVLVFAGVVALGFRRKVLTPAGIGLGALVFVISLITAPLLTIVFWALLSNVVHTYQVTYLGHAPNEMLLLTLFASTTIALTVTWYALIQKVRQVSTPDLTIGAYAILALATVGFAIAMPEASFVSTWAGLFGFLGVGYWFYAIKDDLESFAMGPLIAMIFVAFVAIALMLQVFIASFMSSEANDWFLPIVILVMLLGILVPQLQIITKPKKLWMPLAGWIATVVILVVAILV